MRIRVAVRVHDREEIGPARWKCSHVTPQGRELSMAIRDLGLVLSEPAARWLLSMLTAIMVVDDQPPVWRRSAVEPSIEAPTRDRLAMDIRVAVRVYHPGDVERPRWEGRELVVSVRNLVMVFSEPAARGLHQTLAAALATNESAAEA